MKEVEVIIRTAEDRKKIEQMLESGWKIRERGILSFENEPDRAFVWLYKESE